MTDMFMPSLTFQSGVAVSVTTFTDVIAFLVSSSQYRDHDGGHDDGGGLYQH